LARERRALAVTSRIEHSYVQTPAGDVRRATTLVATRLQVSEIRVLVDEQLAGRLFRSAARCRGAALLALLEALVRVRALVIWGSGWFRVDGDCGSVSHLGRSTTARGL
jgi:hypothetical protein